MKKDRDLLRSLNALGFPLFEPQAEQDANAVLAGVVKSTDLRLLEGFPVVLANSGERGLFDYDKVLQYLEKSSDKTCFQALVLMALALYRVLGLAFVWADKLYKRLPANRERKLSGLVEGFKKDEDLNVADYSMSSQRVKKVFGNYFSRTQTKLNELLSMKEELCLEYALSQVFSPKQKELFLKKLKGEKLTKTEKEYFSRTVKKKVLALANDELHRLSRKLLQ